MAYCPCCETEFCKTEITKCVAKFPDFEWEIRNLVYAKGNGYLVRLYGTNFAETCVLHARVARAQAFLLRVEGFPLDEHRGEVKTQAHKSERSLWESSLAYAGDMYMLQYMRALKNPDFDFSEFRDCVDKWTVDRVRANLDRVEARYFTPGFYAKKIQRAWRHAVSCAHHPVCLARLHREFESGCCA